MVLFLSAFASLFSVVNPLGSVPVFLALTPEHTVKERNKSAFNTTLYFTFILISFFLAGSYILNFFGIDINALRIAGGLVILKSGFALLDGQFAKGKASENQIEESSTHEKEDISFTPMAMPMLSGPGSISLLITLFAEHESFSGRLTIGFVIIVTAIIVYIILRISPLLFKLLGMAGLKAVSRIMGFIVMAIGMQYIIMGVVSLVNSLQ